MQGAEAEFEQIAESFLNSEPRRREIAEQIRSHIVNKYSYDSRMAAMLQFVRDGFATQASKLPNPPLIATV